MGTKALVTAAAFLIGDSEVAVQLKIKPGWHVYWENPGDFGLATEVSGLNKLTFQVPNRFDGTAGMTTYGYERQMTMFGTLAGPVNELDVNWLACKESTCVPGNALVSLASPSVDRSNRLRVLQSGLPKIREASYVRLQEKKILVSWPELQLTQNVECFPNTIADLTTKAQRHIVEKNVLQTELTLKRRQDGAAWLCVVDSDKELGYWILP